MTRTRLVISVTALVLGLVTGVGGADDGSPADWAPPVDPIVVRRGFDPPAERWGSGHRGVDLAGERGQEIRAAGAGEVVYAGDLAGRGVVSVRHGELRTTYEPVDATVAVGDRVGRGEVIGVLQPGHRSTGPMVDSALLHWGLLRGETYLDPLSLLDDRPVRLLPRWSHPRATAAAPRRVAATPSPARRTSSPAAPLTAVGLVAIATVAGAAVLRHR